ncbi:MAG: helix-turn-helix domain-containing protein, partial [Clostridia bacterium]
MSKKTRYTDKEREKAIALYASCGNIAWAAETCGIAESTVRDWIKKANADGGEIADIRAQKRREFAESCWGPINAGVELVSREMRIALDKQAELEALLLLVCDANIPIAEKQRAIKDIGRI